MIGMVQVDIFWAYAFGAGFALAAAHQLTREHRQGLAWWQSRHFVVMLLFMALLFAPSGIYLLSAFPSWETMHVARTFGDLPAWLVTLFAVTNVTQGVLGYWVTRWCVLRRHTTAAVAQVSLSYFGFFFVLVNGWDGTGYHRLLSVNHDDVASWSWSRIGEWLSSPVALTLVVMAVPILPYALGFLVSWLGEGHRDAGAEPRLGPVRGRSALLAVPVVLIFGFGLVPAVVSHLAIVALGAVPGSVLTLLAWAGLLSRRGPLRRIGHGMLDPLTDVPADLREVAAASAIPEPSVGASGS
jgi:hypothetical protein